MSSLKKEFIDFLITEAAEEILFGEGIKIIIKIIQILKLIMTFWKRF